MGIEIKIQVQLQFFSPVHKTCQKFGEFAKCNFSNLNKHFIPLSLSGLRARRDSERAARVRRQDKRGAAAALPGRLPHPAQGEEVQGILQDRQALRMGTQPHVSGGVSCLILGLLVLKKIGFK